MRVQSPISGAMNGSAGNLIFQHYHGRTYGRSKPAIFHYGPTPAQHISQTKFYNVQGQWKVIYEKLKLYVPKTQLKKANAYDKMLLGIFKALQTFQLKPAYKVLPKFGADLFYNIKIQPGSFRVVIKETKIHVIYSAITYTSKVDFNPQYAHALSLDPQSQTIQYDVKPYNGSALDFEFVEKTPEQPSQTRLYYVALSDPFYLSNFFI